MVRFRQWERDSRGVGIPGGDCGGNQEGIEGHGKDTAAWVHCRLGGESSFQDLISRPVDTRPEQGLQQGKST